jgi:hypothetical protein
MRDLRRSRRRDTPAACFPATSVPAADAPMTYQHPLAYLLGLERA